MSSVLESASKTCFFVMLELTLNYDTPVGELQQLRLITLSFLLACLIPFSPHS